MDSNPQTINCNRCRKSRKCATVCPLSPFSDRVGFPGPLDTPHYHTFVNHLLCIICYLLCIIYCLLCIIYYLLCISIASCASILLPQFAMWSCACLSPPVLYVATQLLRCRFDMQKPRLGASAAVLGGKLYIAGGWNGTGHGQTVEVGSSSRILPVY